MKIKSFFVILCLLIGAATVQLSAQSDNKSYQDWHEANWGTYVLCDGVYTDYVYSHVKIHVVAHKKDGIWIWAIEQAKGEGDSYYTDEKFRYKEVDKTSYVDNILTFHFNLKGNMGNHYIGSWTVDLSTGAWTPGKMLCH